MTSKSGSKPSSLISFPRMDNVSLLQNCVFVNFMLKTMLGRDRRSKNVILECFVCWWEASEVGKWKRWKLVR